MSRFPKNHESIYFDKLIRSAKMQSVLSFIYAAYNADKKYPLDDVSYKQDLQERIVNAYKLFNIGGAGTYSGSQSQFQSQYTIGHEMCIWYNSSLRLTQFAKKVAENELTIKQYFDRIFLNYVQPVKENNVHILYALLSYMKSNGVKTIQKDKIPMALGVECAGDMINAICHFMEGTDYFVFNDPVLEYASGLSIEQLIDKCNLTYVGKDGYLKAYEDFIKNDDEANYIKYITSLKDENVVPLKMSQQRAIGGTNTIYYGTPGCGKSYYVDKLFDVEGNKVFRTVFHPEYSNADFVGQVMPDTKSDGSDKVIYKFRDGIFTTALKYALENPSINVILIIEEINRGNASAIFGEIFQLLDRNSRGDSIYSIKNAYIAKALSLDETTDIKIPSNLSLIGTMNTSDQNVYTLDTAFKRRWNMKKMRNSFRDIDNFNSLSDVDKKPFEYKYQLSKRYIPGSSYTWREFIERVNAKISEKGKGYFIQSEDKEVGVYFVSNSYLSQKPNDLNEDLIKNFAEKVLMYLWNDVVKTNPEKLFKMTSSTNTPINSLDNLLDEFETIPNGDTLSVFSGDLFPSKNNNSQDETANTCNAENVNE